MPIALAQSPATGSSGGTSALTITPGSTVTNGNGLVVVVGSISRAPTSVQDNNSVALTQYQGDDFFTSPYSRIYYLSSASGAPTSVTINFGSSTNCWAVVYEVLGTITTNAGNAAHANSTNGHAGAITTSNANTIAFAGIQTSGATSGAPSGYTFDFGSGTAFGAAHVVYTGTQTGIDPTWASSAGGWAATVAAFTSTNTTGVTDLTASLSKGFGLGVTTATDVTEFASSASRGFALGASVAAEVNFVVTSAHGFSLGTVSAQVLPEVRKGFALGTSFPFVLTDNFGNATAGIKLSGRALSDTAELANGRYRR